MTRPVLAVMAGWFDGRVGADIHAQLAEFNPVKISSPWKHGGWPSKRLLGWKTDSYIDKQAPDGPYVALGFSWGATAAARLAERDWRCVGLVYVSGTEWMPNAKPLRSRFDMGHGNRWVGEVTRMLMSNPPIPVFGPGFPVLCLCTEGERRKLVRGTWQTGRNLSRVLADVTAPSPAPNPGTHKRPHLAGVAHHLPAIRAFMDQHFGKETQHGRRLQRERRIVP